MVACQEIQTCHAPDTRIKSAFVPRGAVANALVALVACSALSVTCQAFGLFVYHGKLYRGDDPYDGTARFKFALVNSTGARTYWNNDGTTVNGEPQQAISIRVVNGDYTVSLGGTSSLDTTPTEPVFLRVWCGIDDQSFRKFADQRVSLDSRKIVAGIAQRIPRSSGEAVAKESPIEHNASHRPEYQAKAKEDVGTHVYKSRSTVARALKKSGSWNASYFGHPLGGGWRNAPKGVTSTESSSSSSSGDSANSFSPLPSMPDFDGAPVRRPASESETASEATPAAVSPQSTTVQASLAPEFVETAAAPPKVLSAPAAGPQATPLSQVGETTTTTTAAPGTATSGTTTLPASTSIASSGPSPATVEGAEDHIERMPHMDCDPAAPAEPGKKITVSIWTDTSSQRPGEEDYQPLAIPFPSGMQEARVVVYLVLSHQFALIGKDDSKELVIRPQESASDKVTFTLRVENNAEGIGHITALFFYNGYPCGRVMRSLRIGYPDEDDATASALKNATSSGASRNVASASSIALPQDGPDMTIVVIRTDAGPRYQYFVMAPKATTPRSPVLDWDSYKDPTPQNILESYYARFGESYAREQTRASLIDLGRTLFPKAPAQIRATLRELIDKGATPKSVLVFSDEPYFAWELMSPHWTDKQMLESLPLGAMSAVSRWTCNPQEVFRSPARHVPINKAAFWAPKYTGDDSLANSQSEQDFLQKTMGGQAIDPATYNGICSKLSTNDATVLHFICHGVSDAAEQGMQKILADPEDIPSMPGSESSDKAQYHGSITAGELTRCDGVRQFCSKRPLVFLNACQVGKVIQTLNGNGGFGPAFLDANAGGVVAPLWSVFDQVAESTAKRFYTDLKADPQLSFAEEIRRIREGAYKGDMVDGMSTLAAYTFYGDPLATPSSMNSQ